MWKINPYIIICSFLLYGTALFGQNQAGKVSLQQLLNQLTQVHAVTFNYDSELLTDILVVPPPSELSLNQKLQNLSQQTNLVFKRVSETLITIAPVQTICGYLYERESGAPLLGVSIIGPSIATTSDQNGYFQFNRPSDEAVITFSFMGLKTEIRTGATFDPTNCTKILMNTQAELMSPLLVQAYLVRGINKKKDWTTAIEYDQFSLLPGLIETDVLQTVQALPAITSVDETVSNINIRGGSNDQNLILWDGIKMYQTGHFFGLISSFNPHMTQSSNIINNGTDVSLTDGVSGTIHMQTSKKVASNFSGIAGVNFLNAELFANMPLSTKSSLEVASRKSLNGLWRTPTYDAYFDRVTQFTEAQNNNSEVRSSDQEFGFYDASLRWLYQPSEKDLIQVNFITINNDLNFNETAVFEGVTETRQSSATQNSIAAALHYKRQWNPDLATRFKLTESHYQLRSVNANILSNQRFLQENTVAETQIKIENTWRKNLWEIKLGYDFTEIEVINLNDIDLPRFIRRDEEVLREHASYLQAWYTKNDFSVRAGARANYISKFQKTLIEPRLSIRKSLNENISLEALGEFKHQNTSQIVNFQNDFLGIEKRRWQLTDNDSIPITQSKQASIGMIFQKNAWLVDVKAYYKSVSGITTQSQGFTTKYEFARVKGDYEVFGAELLLRKEFKNLTSWLGYSYMDNTYTFPELQEIQFPSNFDIPHSLTLGSTYTYKPWVLSAGVNYRTGKPTSIPVRDDEVVNGAINYDQAHQKRLKNYLRLDASAMYQWNFNNRLKSEIGASVWNISNRENQINQFYRLNDNKDLNQFTRYSLGWTSNVVWRLYF